MSDTRDLEGAFEGLAALLIMIVGVLDAAGIVTKAAVAESARAMTGDGASPAMRACLLGVAEGLSSPTRQARPTLRLVEGSAQRPTLPSHRRPE